jgi:hypothetical protein
MTLFVSGNTVSPADQAQQIFDLHPRSLDGHCLRCGTEDCIGRHAAMNELRRYDRLPKRRPRITRPELLGAKRFIVGGWSLPRGIHVRPENELEAEP